MTTTSSGSSDRKEEESLYETWMNLQHEELKELEQAVIQAKNGQIHEKELKELIEKIINQFQEYSNNRIRLAQVDVSPYFAPTWCTPLENSAQWIAGCRPSSFIRLVYALSGMDIESRVSEFLEGKKIGDLAELTTKQVGMIDELQSKTIREEARLSSRLASLQEDVVDQPLASKMKKDGCENADEPLDKHSHDMATLMEEADELRMKTLKEIVHVILEPVQAVEYLAAAKKIRLCVQKWGKKRDHKHTNTNLAVD